MKKLRKTEAQMKISIVYVENTGVVVCGGDRSIKMASNSEELLAGDGSEGILTITDSFILFELNNLETEFSATVSEIQDINSEV